MRIWGIGLSRTGTTTLADALAALGFKSAHFVLPRHFQYYSAVTDVTVSVRYKELDLQFPGSKFILTTRSLDSWVCSYQRHIGRIGVPKCGSEWLAEILYYRKRLYGTVGFEATLCRGAYVRHVSDVRSYFASRPNDLLEMDITAGDGWDKLCPFLGRPVPDEPFPWLNKQANTGPRRRLRADTRHSHRTLDMIG